VSRLLSGKIPKIVFYDNGAKKPNGGTKIVTSFWGVWVHSDPMIAGSPEKIYIYI